MDFERVAIIWARIGFVPLSRGVPALAMVCAGAFALGLAVGVPAQAPAGGVAVGGLGSAPVTVSEHARTAPKPASRASSGTRQHHQAAPPPGGAGTAPANGPTIAAPPLPPAESGPPGFYTIPPWQGNDGGWDGPLAECRGQLRAGPQGGDDGGPPAGHGWRAGRHGHHRG